MALFVPKFPYAGAEIPLLPFQNTLVPGSKFPCGGGGISPARAQNSPCGGKNPPVPVKIFLSVWFGVTAVCALVCVPRHDFFSKKLALLFAGTRKVLTFAPAFREGGGPARRRGAVKEKRGRGKKKVGRFRAKPLPLQPVSPWSGGGAPRDGGSLRRGRTKESVL